MNKEKVYESLSDFVAKLEKEGLLVRVKEEVSTILEITEIHHRLIEKKGPAVLFENVISENGKSTMPVLVNLFGTKERIAMALGIKENELSKIGEKLAFLKQPEPPSDLKEAFKMLPILKEVLVMKPKVIKNPPCQAIQYLGDDVDLNILPVQTCWPQEPAPLITWPMVITRGFLGQKDDCYNVGIYRMQVLSKNKTLMRWLKHRGGAEHHRRWSASGSEKMPAAAVIGCDPSTMLAAVTPVPDGISEYEFAGLFRKKKLELTECITVPILVPAHAEIVIEGYVSFDEYGDEGPYGDHTGYYNSVEKFPVFEVTCITTRKSPIYLSTFTGRPPDEPSVLGEALNEIFLPLIRQQFPEIVDFWLPPEGCSYRIAVVSIKKSYPAHAKRVMMGVWSFLRQFTYTKFIIVVDHYINARSWPDIMWAISTKMDFQRDVLNVSNTPIDYLDFASIEPEIGGKMGFDATDKIYPETKREWGRLINMSDDIKEIVTQKWNKYGF
ncbi:MAG: UbiD family decarboxylase [Candidatus Lariskella arthropodorum]|uniref:UbiD family decarboxylase n=1 Tax=Candidatus Lariskella endosymbiont of Epinotia ramella TaxID=3066224 RepID=UPI0030D3B546